MSSKLSISLRFNTTDKTKILKIVLKLKIKFSVANKILLDYDVIKKSIVVMEIFTLILGVLFILFILYCKKYHDKSVLATKLPGPITVPLLGNAILFAGLNPPQLLKKLEDIVKEYGTVIRIMIGHQVQIMLTDPKDAEIILGSQTLIDKSNEYDFIAAWLGTGLLISTGQKWFSRRKVITPTFHFKILEQFVEVFDKHSETFVKNLAKFNGQAVDVFPLVTLCALDNICGK